LAGNRQVFTELTEDSKKRKEKLDKLKKEAEKTADAIKAQDKSNKIL
jgi:hypothetical protein